MDILKAKYDNWHALLLYEIIGQYVFVYSLLLVACRDLRFYEYVKSWTVVLWKTTQCYFMFSVLTLFSYLVFVSYATVPVLVPLPVHLDLDGWMP